MQEPILARKIARGDNWPRLLSKSHALRYALWTTALHLIYHKGSFMFNDQDLAAKVHKSLLSFLIFYIDIYLTKYIETTISKKMNYIYIYILGLLCVDFESCPIQ